MKLPQEFLNKMKTLMNDEEFDEFISSYSQKRYYGLRVNTLKVSVDNFKRISPFELSAIPWTTDGFYYKEGETPGRDPYYYSGLYYIQEPSAMFPGALINVCPGDKVLDICAAPGGKTVQMAAKMKGQGLIVANEINRERTKALVKNIELSGIKNAVVTNESPEKLVRNFKGYFDKILVDAPCSGEGMFRKDEDAVKSWEKYKCEKCSGLQRSILDCVHEMLKPGGTIVYSTCTFSPEEDEIIIDEFINKYKIYTIMDIKKSHGVDNGRPEWAGGNKELAKTVRLWPHKVNGEGHFVAMLQKSEDGQSVVNNRVNFTKAPEVFYRFQNENLNTDIEGCFYQNGNNLYNLPVEFPRLDGLKVAKFGWYLGEFVRDKFEPSHSMITALNKEDLKNVIDFSRNSKELNSYLKGETIINEEINGLKGICVDGFTLGWAKQVDSILKNQYPKGWRKMN